MQECYVLPTIPSCLQKGEMKMKAIRIIVTFAIATVILAALAPTAYAQAYLAGNIYRILTPFDPNDPDHTGCNAPVNHNPPDPSLVPDRSPDALFLVATYFGGIPLDFDSSYPGSSLVAHSWFFHGSHPAYYLVGPADIQYEDLSEYCDQYSTLIDITGWVSVFPGEVFTFDVDDGIWLEINGVVVFQQQDASVGGLPAPPPPAPPVYTATWTGPKGGFAYRLIYIERNGGQARLKVTHN